jgi:hypothetical protein
MFGTWERSDWKNHYTLEAALQSSELIACLANGFLCCESEPVSDDAVASANVACFLPPSKKFGHSIKLWLDVSVWPKPLPKILALRLCQHSHHEPVQSRQVIASAREQLPDPRDIADVSANAQSVREEPWWHGRR